MNALPDHTSFEWQCKQNAVDVRRRLMGPIQRSVEAVKLAPVEIMPEEPKPRPRVPLWRRTPSNFDAHVIDWIARRLYPCKAHMRQRCEDFGITMEDLRGIKRKHPLVYYRHLVMWELKMVVKPDISYPEIGRLMGGRDHSTVIYAVQKIAAQKAAESE